MFNYNQLEEIKRVAKSVKNQGELAVFNKLFIERVDASNVAVNKVKFSLDQALIIEYCAHECKRQRSGEMSVFNMLNAWDFASRDEDWLTKENTLHLTLLFIERVGIIIEPYQNAGGFRQIPIGVGDGMGGWVEKARWDRVPDLLELLLNSYYSGLLDNGWNKLSQSAEDEFYYEYENIHPFRDGNGRSGKILYNYLKGTLGNPQMPPNFWGGNNP